MIYTDKYLNIFTLSLRGVAEAIPASVLIFILKSCSFCVNRSTELTSKSASNCSFWVKVKSDK